MEINGITRIAALEVIPSGNYVGYYWMSDEEKPKRVNGNIELPQSINPFIIEAMLWDEGRQKSIMITHTGKYQIFEYDLNTLPTVGTLEEKAYMAHRLPGIEKVKFKQFWKAECDPNCAGMQVLLLKAQIFVGF